ncbi:hypothetical protein [Sulfitobacter sp. R18_1]|uniref:hypothetical protein n=1 Tax=Sulfitobacter sp. R18_1 TaxID=2821104 RepID=UPI001AD9858A|nr:hypothetical protein [Sulfitobacter sp. R18_1]MBO9428575.1 hypothetical protein [Sulfitobacter sp. R18_1]
MTKAPENIDFTMAQEILFFLADREDHRAMVAVEEDEIVKIRDQEDDLRVSSEILKDYVEATVPEVHVCEDYTNIVGLQMIHDALDKALPWANDQRRHPKDLERGLRTKLRIERSINKLSENAPASPTMQ